MHSILFPSFDPVAFYVASFPVRWYGLAYFLGFLGAWQSCLRLLKASPGFRIFNKSDGDDFLIWALGGVVLGGRLGYVLFYRPSFYWRFPWEILQTWKGGMAFHGGLLGVCLALWLYCRWRKLPLLSFADWICCGVPIGLFLGRIANFINEELYGRVTTVPWGVIFPSAGGQPRHPSQLYEAFLEGAVLFVILQISAQNKNISTRAGVLCGFFLTGYGASRIFVECFREPDSFMGFFMGFLTAGQLLSFPLVFLGIFLICRGFYNNPQEV